MSDVIKWRDTTTYSRDDKERNPTMYSIKYGHLDICITCGHIYHRGEWVLHCFSIGIDTQPITTFIDKCRLTAYDPVEVVKQRAIEIVEARIDDIREYRRYYQYQESGKMKIYDGCSGGMSKIYRFFGKIPPWEFCCDIHDQPYAKGGTWLARMKADTDFYQCIKNNGHPHVAKIMFYAVRIGGVPWLPTPFRWGFETKTYRYKK